MGWYRQTDGNADRRTDGQTCMCVCVFVYASWPSSYGQKMRKHPPFFGRCDPGTDASLRHTPTQYAAYEMERKISAANMMRAAVIMYALESLRSVRSGGYGGYWRVRELSYGSFGNARPATSWINGASGGSNGGCGGRGSADGGTGSTGGGGEGDGG